MCTQYSVLKSSPTYTVHLIRLLMLSTERISSIRLKNFLTIFHMFCFNCFEQFLNNPLRNNLLHFAFTILFFFSFGFFVSCKCLQIFRITWISANECVNKCKWIECPWEKYRLPNIHCTLGVQAKQIHETHWWWTFCPRFCCYNSRKLPIIVT